MFEVLTSDIINFINGDSSLKIRDDLYADFWNGPHPLIEFWNPQDYIGEIYLNNLEFSMPFEIDFLDECLSLAKEFSESAVIITYLGKLKQLEFYL